MRINRFFLMPVFLFGTVAASAQDIIEAYNFSNLSVQGTARSMGFGNALGSVGGDFSSLSVNPAGIGIYRSSELVFTPSMQVNTASSQYLGKTTADDKTNFNVNNFGIVLTSAAKGKRYENSNWKTVSFAFGMNRVADFNANYSYSGKNTASSASQVFESAANINPVGASSSAASNDLGYIGYQSYLINKNINGIYESVVPFKGGVDQYKSDHTSGGINEYTISLGGNYKEKLMLGATLGLTSVNYHLSSYYRESVSNGNTAANPDNFVSFNYTNTLDITGGGVNLKLGAIYKINDNIRIGAAFHSPTYYSLTDVSNPDILSVTNHSTYALSVANGGVVQNQFDYSLSTPLKGILSATYIIKNIGFVTADYEYVNYNSMRFLYPGGVDASGYTYQYYEDAINQDIKNTYHGSSNVRIGAEAVLAKYFMFRAGFGYYGNAFSSDATINSQHIDISGGLGFHFNHFFTDIAIVHSSFKQDSYPYVIDYSGIVTSSPAPASKASVAFNNNNLAWTIGIKF